LVLVNTTFLSSIGAFSSLHLLKCPSEAENVARCRKQLTTGLMQPGCALQAEISVDNVANIFKTLSVSDVQRRPRIQLVRGEIEPQEAATTNAPHRSSSQTNDRCSFWRPIRMDIQPQCSSHRLGFF
jgi:hypothetical protein